MFQYPVRVMGRLVARNPAAGPVERSHCIEGCACLPKTAPPRTQVRHHGFCVSYEGASETQPTLCLTCETQTATDAYAVAMRLTDSPYTLAERMATAPRVIPTAFLSGIP